MYKNQATLFKHKTKETFQSALTKLSGNTITTDCFLMIAFLYILTYIQVIFIVQMSL